jgi:hypothetical protein
MRKLKKGTDPINSYNQAVFLISTNRELLFQGGKGTTINYGAIK